MTEINKEARFLIEERFGLVWIEGEISNLSRPGSGHWYFSLKDNRAQIRCAMFASRNRFVRDTPNNGTTVVVRGRLSSTRRAASSNSSSITSHRRAKGHSRQRSICW